jgi:hypothetical protein
MATENNGDKTATGKNGNTGIHSSRPEAKHWSFTLNNYNPEDGDNLSIKFNTLYKCRFVMGFEIGEQKTPHIQGHCSFLKKMRLSALKKIDARIHWEMDRNRDSAEKYCLKDNNYICNFDIELKLNLTKPSFDWHLQIFNIIAEPADIRTIHWFWESNGNVGKTWMSKWLVARHNALILSGKNNDCSNQILKTIESGLEIKIVIFDIPRCSKDFISYQAIEAIKNGLLYSGKYEGGICVFNSPHVIIFANSPPDVGKLSLDRWNIVEITHL